MIEGPLTGATESDAASSADVTALAATVATNATSINANATAIAGKQDTITGTFTNTLQTFTTPVTITSDLQCVGLGKNIIIGNGNPTSTRGRIRCSQHLNVDCPTGGGIVSFQFTGGTGGVYFSNGAGSVIATISNTGVYSQMSDDRVKFEQEDIADGWSVISQLKPQRYIKTFKTEDDPSTGWRECGFIAQEVLQIPQLSHAVTLPDPTAEVPTPLYSLDYGQVLPYLVACVQQLQARVVALEA